MVWGLILGNKIISDINFILWSVICTRSDSCEHKQVSDIFSSIFSFREYSPIYQFIWIYKNHANGICTYMSSWLFLKVWAVLRQQKQNLWSCWPKLDTQSCGTFYATWLPGALRKYFVFHPFSMFSLGLRKSVSSEKPHWEKKISPSGQMSKNGPLARFIPQFFLNTHTQCDHGLRTGVRGITHTSSAYEHKRFFFPR